MLTKETLLGKSWASVILCKVTDRPDQRCERMPQVTGLSPSLTSETTTREKK